MHDLNDWDSRSHVQTLVLMSATSLGIYFCYLIAVPFLSPLTWAMALATLFVPFQRWMEARLTNSSVASLIAVLIIGLIVVIPVTFVGQRLFLEAAQGAQLIEVKVDSGEWQRALEAEPRLASIVAKISQLVDLPGTLKSVAAWLSITAGSILKGSVFKVLDVCLTFYFLFFFLRDRRIVLNALRYLSPLSKESMNRLFVNVSDTIYATIYGTLAVSCVQGFLGGLMFWWLGLPAPLLWGVIMSMLAVVPVLGAFVVWLPAALYLAFEGHWEKALILTLWGMLIVGTIDNLLRPILVGGRLKQHTVLAFISVVGGLFVFGTTGLVLGPIALTITIVLLEAWPERQAQHEVKNENLTSIERLSISKVGPHIR